VTFLAVACHCLHLSSLSTQEVPASEFIFVDHTALSLNPNAQSAGSSSSGGDSGGDGSGGIGGSVHELDRSGLRPDGSLDLSELEQFLKFLEGAFDLHIRFLRVASGNSGGKGGSSEGGSSYLDVLRAAAELASGRLLCLVEAGNILQPGGLAALVGTVAAYPEAAMVVPMLLRQDGKVHEAGGVILSDGTLVSAARTPFTPTMPVVRRFGLQPRRNGDKPPSPRTPPLSST